MYSKLTDNYIPTNKCNSRNGNPIKKITVHHMVAIWTGKRCAEYFRDSARDASANYCIGVEGDVACNVDEENRAWTSGSYWNDSQAITIECANESLGGDYPISKTTWDKLVELCVDICRRYGFRLNFTGDGNGSLTFHYMYQATSCPGPYMKARAQQLCDEVNAKLDEIPQVEPVKSIDELAKEVLRGVWGNGSERKQRLEANGYDYNAVQARVNEILNGGNQTPKSVEELAQEVLRGVWGNGDERRMRLNNAGYDYNAVQNKVNEILYGSKPQMSARDFALEVWRKGSYGNGEERKRNAERLGVDYNEAQRLINILANGGNI